ncbi:10759_t:CDS:2 [Ambispora gerdemannii]|uniref:10759_t:CDS:1 n=1 Tax=Ambispora gerdemannii TaxID=144530 RepID=A0A9N9AC32_9GLOM|nr:10759_t:CDS:2 [Ambispora gerdemannii]
MEEIKENIGNRISISPERPKTPNHIGTYTPLKSVDIVGNTNSTPTTPTAPSNSPIDDKKKTPRKSEKPLAEETRKLFLTPEKLGSIKRAQLQKYCKRYGIKANLKNTELIQKLQEYALNHENQPNENIDDDFSSFNIAGLSVDDPLNPQKQDQSSKDEEITIGNQEEEDDSLQPTNESIKNASITQFPKEIARLSFVMENKHSSIPLPSPRISSFMARKIATPIKRSPLRYSMSNQSSSSGKKPIYDEKSPLVDHSASSNPEIQNNESINETNRNTSSPKKEETLNTHQNDANPSEQQQTEENQESYDPLTSPEPFVFNSGMRVDDSTFQTAAAAVLAELERRVAEVQKLPTPEIKKYLGELTQSPRMKKLSQSIEEGEGLTPSRFNKLHKKNFDKMQSIVNHYAAQRRKADEELEVSPIKKKKLIHSTNDQDLAKTSQPIYEDKSDEKNNESENLRTKHHKKSLLRRPSGFNKNRKPKVTSVTKSGITARLSTFDFDSRLKKPSSYNIAHANSNKASASTSIPMKQNKERVEFGKREAAKNVVEQKIRNPSSIHQIPEKAKSKISSGFAQGITKPVSNLKTKPPPRLNTASQSSQPKIIGKNSSSRPFFARQIYQQNATKGSYRDNTTTITDKQKTKKEKATLEQLSQEEIKNELGFKIQNKFMKSHKSQVPPFSQKKVGKNKK